MKCIGNMSNLDNIELGEADIFTQKYNKYNVHQLLVV